MNHWPHHYRAALSEIERYRDLVNAVLALGAHRRRGLDPDRARSRLESVAHGIRCRIPHLSSRRRATGPRGVDGVLAHLHDGLFEERGLGRGGPVVPHPDAMDLDLVLQGVPGMPVACALVYCSVAERVGLDTFGLELPGRFFVGIRDVAHHRISLVDPACGGRIVDRLEFRAIAEELDADEDPARLMKPAVPARWLKRWLQDLSTASARAGEVHLLDDWAKLTTETETILGT